MQTTQPTPTGIARFIPGLTLIKGFSPALLRSSVGVRRGGGISRAVRRVVEESMQLNLASAIQAL